MKIKCTYLNIGKLINLKNKIKQKNILLLYVIFPYSETKVS